MCREKMSKNNPRTKRDMTSVDECRCVGVETVDQADYKKSKREVGSTEKRAKQRKISKVRLPTPPPDPTLCEDGKCSEFLDYLESLQKGPHQNLSRTNSAFASTMAAEDAFDHLEKLYKLMEQMLILREQNTKLHRRVRDLEHLRNIQNMHMQLKNLESVEVPEVDKDTIFAESLLDTILMGTKRDSKHKQSQSSRLRQSILRRQRHRSNSITLDRRPNLDNVGDNIQNRRSSALCNNGQDKPSKVSKWTKVKAAFKWEKASQTVSDVKSQDSGISGMLPVNYEVARYLRVPSTSEEPSISPADSGAAEISTPGTISPASSVEEVFCTAGRKRIQEDTSDDDRSFSLEYIPHSKEEFNSSQKTKGHRTPWAKMKDIIQTRNSFKKRNRLSGRSDDSKADESGNDDVFEHKESKNGQIKDEHPIPLDVIARYQQALAEDSMNTNASDDSKWTRVKRAFLSTPSISRTENVSPINPPLENYGEKNGNVSKLQEEIQKNYRELQNKLSLEFQGKMREWERMKQGGASSGLPLSPEEAKEQAFKKKMEEWEKIKGQPKHNLQLQSEEHLPPEFRKKLQEWQKIKKSATKDDVSTSSNSPKRKLGDWPKWKSISGHRSENSHPEGQALSEDFLKKLESWKQLKASNSISVEDYDSKDPAKTNSPKLSRKNGSGRQSKKIKDQTEKELQWFEKELNKIEREKQRLERERQKFMEREERLTKLRLSVMGGNKRDILVHTSSGFYRFEGISRKFTQKLYEWEKAQGIGPEASTFALLNSCYIPNVRVVNFQDEPPPLPRLVKSKSADSILNNSELNITHPLGSRDPSSLSLNDMENLENECLLDARISSVPDIIRSRENVDEEEPEAVIVEVEDIVEETAGPLQHYKDMMVHVPIYQKQETPSMCEGETRAAPKVQRSESARAQNNYNLIEDIITLLKVLTENENDIGQHEQIQILSNDEMDRERKSQYLQNVYHTQVDMAIRLSDKLTRLQEANAKVTTNIANEIGFSASRLSDVLDTVQDLSADLLQMGEKLQAEMQLRKENRGVSISRQNYPNIMRVLSQQNTKILDLRRVLSYLCAASDSTAPGRKKKILRRTSTPKDVTEEKQESDAELTAQIAQGAIKKRYRYRQKGVNTQTLEESDDEGTRVQRKNKQKKPPQKQTADVEVDLGVVQKVAIPTQTNYMSAAEPQTRDSPVQVFVKTTRKLFTPIVTSSFAIACRKYEISETPTITSTPSFHRNHINSDTITSPISHLPPLPASPTPQRKLSKDISPNIRLMMVKYNQKLQEHESLCGKSGGSSGSSSPIPWRSPVLERRVKAQTERYQQDLLKISPLLGGRREVQKSASLSVVNTGDKQVTLHNQNDEIEAMTRRGILKSSSTNTLTLKSERLKNGPLKLKIPEPERVFDNSEARSYKLFKAKEDFLNSPVSPISAPPLLINEDEVKYPSRNRLSQISVGSESSYDSSACEGILIKSASAGMINIEADAYRQIDPEVHGGGYVSLPRSCKKRKEGIISNIASKFRKVKMRRSKEGGSKMNTISTLCRQSLVVDINSASQETLTGESPVSSRKDSLTVPSDSKGSSSGDGDTSPSSSTSGSWIKRQKLFKSKQ